MNNNLNSIYPLSYDTFLNDVQRFKKAGGPNTDSFNFFDSPSHKYYKIFFYFGTKSEKHVNDVSHEYSGLLAPTWTYRHKHFEELSGANYYRSNYHVKDRVRSEPNNIDIYNIEVTSSNNAYRNAITQLEDHGTDYDAYKDALKFWEGEDISVDNSSNFTGYVTYNEDGKAACGLKFENGILIDYEVFDNRSSKVAYIVKDVVGHQSYRLDLEMEMLKAKEVYFNTLAKKHKRQLEHDAFLVNYLSKLQQYYNDTSTNFKANEFYLFNTAWSYLMLQGFEDKAVQLRQFIELLSNISIESPWYFSSVSGIFDALNRKSIDTGKLDLNNRSKITIKCLPDAFDNRIGTLLDLYRSVVFDWNNKREIIPANLRKFDMAIYVFEAPDQRWHEEEKDNLSNIKEKWKAAYDNSMGNTLKSIFPNAINNNEQSNYSKNRASLIGIGEDGNFNFLASHKLIEFHDCEINYNTGTSAWAALDNKTGFTPEYNIEITFADCYEISYNDLFRQYYGDTSCFIEKDLPEFNEKQKELLNKRVTPKSDNWLKSLGNGLLDRLNDKGLSLVKNLAFGNLYGFSLKNSLEQISNGIQNPITAFDTVMGYAKNGKEMFQQSKKQSKTIADTITNNVLNTVGFNEFKTEYSSNGLSSSNYNISNPATMQIPSDTQVKRQNDDSSNNYVKYIKQQLNSDNNIADNNILPTKKSQFTGGSLFEAYTKSKAIKSSNNNGNIFKASTVANNL